jgi:hypothetical protein
MSSTNVPFYWDSTAHTLALTTIYRVGLPSGTTEWTVLNPSLQPIFIAGTEATITSAATPPPYVGVLAGTAQSGKGQSLYIANRTPGPLDIGLTWGRPGRQPEMDAGTVTFEAI